MTISLAAGPGSAVRLPIRVIETRVYRGPNMFSRRAMVRMRVDVGGFTHRLEQGTWLGHVIEHVALELQTLAGTPVSRGKTRSGRGLPGRYDIIFRYRD